MQRCPCSTPRLVSVHTDTRAHRGPCRASSILRSRSLSATSPAPLLPVWPTSCVLLLVLSLHFSNGRSCRSHCVQRVAPCTSLVTAELSIHLLTIVRLALALSSPDTALSPTSSGNLQLDRVFPSSSCTSRSVTSSRSNSRPVRLTAASSSKVSLPVLSLGTHDC